MTAAVWCVLAATLAGAPPWEGAPFAGDPADLLREARKLTVAEGIELDLLLETWALEFDAEGREVTTHRLVFRPLTEAAARSWSRVEDGWSASYQARPEVKARVVSPEGQVRWLDPATLVDSVPGQRDGVFSDHRVLQGPLPAIEPGALVEELHVTRGTAAFFKAGVASRFYAHRGVPVRRLLIRAEAPVSVPLRHAVRGLPAPKEEVANGRKILSIDLADLPAPPDRELGLPPDQVPLRTLAVSTGAGWREVSRAYAALAEAQLEGADLAATAKSIVAPGDGPKEAAAKVLAWIAARTRYTGLTLGEAGLTPARPAATLERGYGDCKDLSLLAVALLRAAGHRASLALLRTELPEVEPGLPGLGLFDHAVAVVEAKPPVWLDPANGMPAGQVGTWSQGRLALLADGRATGLVPAPVTASEANTMVRERRIELAEAGQASAVDDATFRGVQAVNVRDNARSQKAGEWEKRARARMEAADGSEVTVKLELGAGPGEAARFHAVAERSGWGHTGDDTAEAKVSSWQVLASLPDVLTPGDEKAPEPKRRQGPYLMPDPYRAEVTYRVVPPPGFRPLAPPAEDRFEIGPARYRATSAAQADGSVLVRYTFEVGRRLEPEQFNALRAAVVERANADVPLVRFERTSRALLEAGKGREAVDELRRLVALHPREARHHAHLSMALLNLGLGQAARDEARRAVEVEPANEWPLRVLAWALEADLVGRHFAEGADLAGAEAALRKARDLAPKAAQPRASLAELLVRLPFGEWYGAASRLDDALAELRFIHDDLKDKTHDDLYAQVLLAAGRTAEAQKVARAMPATATRNGLVLAAAMVQGGAEGMRKELKSIPAAEQMGAIQAATMGLFGSRKYEALAELFKGNDALWPGTKLRYGDVLAKARRLESMTFDPKVPDQVLQRIYQAAVAASPDAAMRRVVVQRPLLPELSEGQRGVAAELKAGILKGTPANFGATFEAMDRRAIMELAVAIMVSKVEGDGPPWRVLASTGDGTGKLLTMVVQREDGEARLAAADPDPALLGAMALALLERGDLPAARRLVGWAMGDVKEAGRKQKAESLAPLWRETGEASRDEVDATALALAADRVLPAADLERLLARSEGATGPSRQALATAVVAAAWTSGTPAALEGRLAAIGAEFPDLKERADNAAVAVLQRAGRSKEVAQRLEALLAARPDAAWARRRLRALREQAGDFEAAERVSQQLLGAKAPIASDFNSAAWLQLFRSGDLARAADWADQGVKAGGGRDADVLHTLATVQAFAGKPDEAVETLKKAIVAGPNTLRHVDWLVLGRVAEAYGLPDEARACYGRVEPPAAPNTVASHALARRRLEALPPPARAP